MRWTERRRRPTIRAGAIVVAVVGAVAIAACGGDGGTGDRQAEVAERGQEVMPFDLDATTHTFTDTDTGGVQSVTADDPDDDRQIELIRGHLRKEKERFSRGDFDDPAAIHGEDMPGVAELADGYDRITVTYVERPDGAALVYTTNDPELVEAVHAWFERQVMDHGEHAHAG
jgi:hypothetical protein